MTDEQMPDNAQPFLNRRINDDIARFIMALVLALMVVCLTAVIVFAQLTQSKELLLGSVIGTIVGGLIGTVNYYNKSGIAADRQKDDTLNKMAHTAASIQAAATPGPITVVPAGESITVAAGEGSVADASARKAD